MKAAVLLFALCSVAVTAKPVTSPLVPKLFRGDWSLVSQECAPGVHDSGMMRVTAKQIIHFESRGKVHRVVVLDPHTIRVESRFTHNGGNFGSIDMFVLSNDARHLTIGEMSDKSEYKKCAK